MFKKVFRYLAYRIYIAGKDVYEKKKSTDQILYFNRFGLIDSEAIFTDEASIENTQNDRRKITIGKKSLIRGNLMLFKSGGEIHIGDYCFVGPGTRIWSAIKIKIGNRVLISHDVNIHDNISHPIESVKRHEDFVHIISKGFQPEVDLKAKEVIIEDDVWIGFNCTILKGVRIGKGAIIGAGTTITKDVPEYSVVVGNPARVIKKTT
jgi:acetyltransferase-like isoleucine patch superfamily enzyme